MPSKDTNGSSNIYQSRGREGGGDLSPFDSAIMFGSKAFWNTIV